MISKKGNIPVHPLNYAAISQETAFTRDDVELCVKHILQVMNRSIQARKNIEFTFNSIGKLQIRDSKVKMKFFKEFIGNFEDSGKIIADMQNVSDLFEVNFKNRYVSDLKEDL